MADDEKAPETDAAADAASTEDAPKADDAPTEAEAPKAEDTFVSDDETPKAEESGATPEADASEDKGDEKAEEKADDTPAEPAAEAAGDEDGDDDSSSSSSSSEEAEAEADPEAELEAARALVAKPEKGARHAATGKRKRSVARVVITPGSGQFNLNGRKLEEYFPRVAHRHRVTEPIEVAGAGGSWDIWASMHGGGDTGQADALRLGIAKALGEIDPNVRTQLKSRGYLRFDTRQVERKKAGLKKARKRPQFSKR